MVTQAEDDRLEVSQSNEVIFMKGADTRDSLSSDFECMHKLIDSQYDAMQ